MDIYKINHPRNRYQSPSYMGGYNRPAYKPNNGANHLTSVKLLRSPTPYMTAPIMVVPQPVGVYNDYQGCFAMEEDVPKFLRAINDSKLASVVRQSLNREKFRIQGWRVRKLDGGAGNPVSLGLFRYEGVGQDQNEWLDWSIILKVIQSPAHLGYVNFGEADNQNHWNYWKRELLVYQSGWLTTLPEGITAPRCYEAVELPDNIAGLWLEDVNDSFSGTWPLYRYALTARHLGRLNGTFISRRELPTYPWFSMNRTRQWLRSINWQDFPWDHPRARQQFPATEVNNFRRMLLEHERYLSRLDQLPKTISHGDTFPANFKSRRLSRGVEQTVAMDWALTGIEPLGDDLGQLVYGTYMNLKGYKLQDISHTLLTSYINGLEDSGCRVDPKWVRFGYTASAAFRVGLYKLNLLKDTVSDEQDLIPHFINPVVVTDSFESFMADEARQLLAVL